MEGDEENQSRCRRVQATRTATYSGRTYTAWDQLDAGITTDKHFKDRYRYADHYSKVQAIFIKAGRNLLEGELCLDLWYYINPLFETPTRLLH